MILTVSFDISDDDESGMCVMEEVNKNAYKYKCLKIETGEQADLLYKALTDQSFKIQERKEQ